MAPILMCRNAKLKSFFHFYAATFLQKLGWVNWGHIFEGKKEGKKALVYVKQVTGVYGLTVYIILVLTPSGIEEKDQRLSEIRVVFSLQSGTVRWLAAPAEPPPFTRCPTPPLTHSTTLLVSTLLHLIVWSQFKPQTSFNEGLHSHPNFPRLLAAWRTPGSPGCPCRANAAFISAGLQCL